MTKVNTFGNTRGDIRHGKGEKKKKLVIDEEVGSFFAFTLYGRMMKKQSAEAEDNQVAAGV